MALPTFDKRFNKVFASERGRGLSIRPEEHASFIDLSPLAAVGEVAINLHKEAKQRSDAIWALKQMSDLREDINIHQMESQQSYVPGSGGYVDGELKYYDEKLDDLASNAPSQQAADMLKRNAYSYRSTVADSSVSYEFSSKLAKQTDDFNTALEKNKIAVYHNPASMLSVIDETLNSVEYMGLPESKKIEASKMIKEQLAISNISSRMDRLDELDNLQAKLAGYKEINKELDSGAWDSFIDFKTFASAESQTGSKIQQVKDKLEQRRLAALAIEAATLNSDMEDDIASLQETGQGVLDPERVKFMSQQLGKPKMYSDYMKARKQALQVNGIISTFDAGDPNAATEMLAKLKPAPGEQGYASKMKLYNQVGTLIASRATALMEDPAIITTNNPSVINAFKVNEQKGIQASIAQQQRFGIQPANYRVLTNNQAKTMAAQLNMMGPDQARQQMAEWEKKYNFQIAPGMSAMTRVQNELVQNGLNPNYAVINSLKNSPVSYDLLTATKIGYKNLSDNLPNSQKASNFESSISNQISDFNRAVTLSTGRSDAIMPLKNSASMLAMHYYSTGRASTVSGAAKLATKALIDDNYSVHDSRKNRNYSYYIPRRVGSYNVNSDKVNDNLKYLQNTGKISSFLSNKSGTGFNVSDSKSVRNVYGIYSSVPGLSQKFTKEQVAKSASGRGVWINSVDGSGVYLGVELNENQGVIPILDDNGHKYEFSFKDLSEKDFR